MPCVAPTTPDIRLLVFITILDHQFLCLKPCQQGLNSFNISACFAWVTRGESNESMQCSLSCRLNLCLTRICDRACCPTFTLHDSEKWPDAGMAPQQLALVPEAPACLPQFRAPGQGVGQMGRPARRPPAHRHGRRLLRDDSAAVAAVRQPHGHIHGGGREAAAHHTTQVCST